MGGENEKQVCYNNEILTSTPSAASAPWRRTERLFLATFLIGRLYVFCERLGTVIGFDSGAQIEMVTKLSWSMPDTPIRESFYGYHPPLGFLVPRLLHVGLGFTPEISIQIVSMMASLAAFFFLRATLRYMHVLHRPSGIAFLYITSSIPIQVSVSTSVNLDVIILAFGASILYASVRMLWPVTLFDDANHPQRSLPLRFSWGDTAECERRINGMVAAFAAATALVCALLTKFSGVLLFAVPSLLAWSQPYARGWWKRCFTGAAVCSVALAIAFPYYYGRYYVPEGKFFPLNAEWTAAADVERAIAQRDADLATFFIDLVSPTTVHASVGPTQTDYDVNRLSDAWRDLWIRNQWTGPTSDAALDLGLLYMVVIPWLMGLGAAIFLRRMRRRTAWTRLGWVLLGFSMLQIAALVQYIYRIPHAGYGPAKGLYILPTVWGIGYLVVTAFREHRLLPKMLRSRIPMIPYALLAAAWMFVAVNHAIPAY